MITKDTLIKASNVASILDTKSIALKLKPDSTVTDLVATLSLPVEVDDNSFDSIVTETNASPAQDAAGHAPSKYEGRLNAITRDTVPDFKEFLSIVKNTINPLIASLSDKVRDQVSVQDAKDILPVQVNTTPIPSVLLNHEFFSTLNRFKDEQVLNIDIPSKPNFPDIPVQDLVVRIANYPVVGGEITTIVGEDTIKEVYHGIFRQNWFGVNKLDHYLNFHPNHVNISLVVFILAQSFLHDPVATDTDSGIYTNTLSTLQGQAARALVTYVEVFESQAKNGIIIHRSSPKEIVVNPFIYHDWIKDGGDVEAIMGLSLQSKPYASLDEINKNKDALKASWQTHLTKHTDISSATMLRKVKESLEYQFNRLFTEGFVNATELQIKETLERFSNLLSHVRNEDLEHLDILCLKLVSRSLTPVYPNINAEVFLANVEEACNRYPDITTREAATIAAIFYLTDTYCNELTLERVA